MEAMLNKVAMSGVEGRIDGLARSMQDADAMFKEKLQKFLKDSPGSSNPALDEVRKKQLDEMLDGKIHSAFEGLRNDNLFIWK